LGLARRENIIGAPMEIDEGMQDKEDSCDDIDDLLSYFTAHHSFTSTHVLEKV
jgi:hypothetical protein